MSFGSPAAPYTIYALCITYCFVFKSAFLWIEMSASCGALASPNGLGEADNLQKLQIILIKTAASELQTIAG